MDFIAGCGLWPAWLSQQWQVETEQPWAWKCALARSRQAQMQQSHLVLVRPYTSLTLPLCLLCLPQLALCGGCICSSSNAVEGIQCCLGLGFCLIRSSHLLLGSRLCLSRRDDVYQNKRFCCSEGAIHFQSLCNFAEYFLACILQLKPCSKFAATGWLSSPVAFLCPAAWSSGHAAGPMLCLSCHNLIARSLATISLL